jgi:enoyl-CoA hydratase
MATSASVTVEAVETGIRVVTLNRPDRLNAIDFDLVVDLHDALDEIAADPTVKVAVLTGAGRGFCAGLDLKDHGSPPPPGGHRHLHAGIDGQTFMSNLTVHLRDVPAVVIAAVNGPAFGGGLALACAADLRIASRSARFCSAFIRTGLSGTDIGITYLLPRLVGSAHAYDLILTGRDIDADEALRMGLVSRVVDDEDLLAEAIDVARQMNRYTHSGLVSTKQVLRLTVDSPSLEAAIALEARNQMLVNHAPDVRAHMEAYRQAKTGADRADRADRAADRGDER